jgi:hypothetical protein
MPQFLAQRLANKASSNAAKIKRWVSALCDVGEDATVMVTELRCSEPGCPPLETVIAILSDGGNRQYKLHKPIAEVVGADVRVLSNAADERSTRSNQSKKGVD